jgi:hypothetical protein
MKGEHVCEALAHGPLLESKIRKSLAESDVDLLCVQWKRTGAIDRYPLPVDSHHQRAHDVGTFPAFHPEA